MVFSFPRPPREVPSAFSQPTTKATALKDLKSWINFPVVVKVYQIYKYYYPFNL